MEEIEKQPEDKKRKRLLLLLLLLLLLSVGGYFIYQHFNQPETPVTVVSGEFLPDGKDASKISNKELRQLAQQKVDKSKFNLMILPEATIDEQTMTGNITIRNPEENAYPVNVEIRNAETNEIVYTSGAIQPGYEIKEGTLEKRLEKGEHKATALFSIYDPETKEKRGQVAAGITLKIQ